MWPALVIFIGGLMSAAGALWAEERINKTSEVRKSVPQERKGKKHKRIHRFLRVFLKPSIIIAVGSMIGISGALWSGYEQARSEREIRAMMTGGDSYCYVRFSNLGTADSSFLMVIHKGDFPLYDVDVRMTDLDKFEESMKQNKAPTLAGMKQSELRIPVGNLPPNQVLMWDEFNFPRSDRLRYNIFISAKNGFFDELLRLQKVNGVWKSALKVERKNYNEADPNAPPTVLVEDIDPDFPRGADGKVQW